jgi:o-succinylbenzoate synthase
MAHPESITAYRLRVPLLNPYHLAFGTVTHFDSIVVAARDAGERCGLGEAAVLTGYTDETIDDAWRTACSFAPRLIDTATDIRVSLQQLQRTHPFTATAFGTALEMLESANTHWRIAADVPLLGLLDAREPEDIERQFDSRLAGGYRTIKIKVGFDVAADIRFVADVQRAVRGRAQIRIDANQGYSAAQGEQFVQALDPQDIELFEQPCAAGDWDAHLRVAHAARVPLMLDESIYGIEDIERAAALRCAQFIKLKLMKFGTMRALADAIHRIRALGMQPVLGNGVACDLGCWLEALVAARHIDNAGEMNGFLKAQFDLLDPPLPYADAAIRLNESYMPVLNMDNVRRCCVDSMTVERSASRGGASLRRHA